jgi:hypothetical protein
LEPKTMDEKIVNSGLIVDNDKVNNSY